MSDRQETYEVRYEPNVLIPLEHGTELSAAAFLPVGPGPFPVVLSVYPYHKDELFGTFVEPANRYFAARGYAAVIADLRGTGGSSGESPGAFHHTGEAADCAAAVEWIAEQDWCDGNIGMWGISYGGITALNAAAKQPPHLKAIVPILGSTPDQYQDWFAPGGCPKLLRPHLWGTTQLCHQLSPPMHNDADGRWYEIWRERLDNTREPWLIQWGDHPLPDAYWDQRMTDVSQISVPTFMIAGWRDLFPESTVRAFERIEAPRRLLIGPWVHEFPADAPLAPVDHLAEMCRWWDQWLRDENTGVKDEAPVTYYLQGSGTWMEESVWPPPGATDANFFLGVNGALDEQASDAGSSVRYFADPSVGYTAGDNNPGGAPIDQRPDDIRSLTFTTKELTKPLVIAGSSEAILHLAVEDTTDANLVVKLCDVAPDGSSTLISAGWLKASTRTSHEHPEQLEPGQVYEFHVTIWVTAYEIAEGHKLRLAFSCADFPRIWPTIQNPTVRLLLGGDEASFVRIPTASLTRAKVDPPLPGRPPVPTRDGVGHKIVSRKLETDETSIEHYTRGVAKTPEGHRMELETRAVATVEAAHPEKARTISTATARFALPSGGEAFVEARSHVTQYGRMVSGRVERDGQLIFERQWLR